MRGQKRVEDARRRAGVPRIQLFKGNEGVDGRDRPGQDGGGKFTVMRGLVPRIHVCGEASKMWMAGTGPGMTNAKRQTVKTTVSRHWTAEIWRGFGPDPMKRAVVSARIMRRGMRSA